MIGPANTSELGDTGGMDTTPPVPGHEPLTAEDRCDRCGAQAYLRVIMAGDAELLFCAHHKREYADALWPKAVVWHDETSALTASG